MYLISAASFNKRLFYIPAARILLLFISLKMARWKGRNDIPAYVQGPLKKCRLLEAQEDFVILFGFAETIRSKATLL